MPRGQTASEFSLRERKRIAFDMFTRGFDNTRVADRLNVRPSTVAAYREEYETELASQLASNPNLLRNVLENTVRALAELDQVRLAAWEEYERATHGVEATCPDCAHVFNVGGISHVSTRQAILGQITRAQELRAKLLGLFGVKQEFLLHVQSVRVIQEAILAFMREELCIEDKLKLEALLMELNRDVRRTEDMPVFPAIEAEGAVHAH